MPSTSPSTLFICTRCRPAAAAEPDGPRPGAALLAAVRMAAADMKDLQVVGIACLSGCRRACAAALMAPAKVGYLFGDLTPDAVGAADLLAVARAHAARPDGVLPRAGRPERLRTGILARLPPLHWKPETDGADITWPS